MTMMEETYNWLLLFLPMRRGSLLYEPLYKFILEYYQHGLFAYSESKWMPTSLGTYNDDGPQVLTLQMLSAGFVVWLACVVISAVVFLLEIIVGEYRYRRQE